MKKTLLAAGFLLTCVVFSALTAWAVSAGDNDQTTAQPSNAPVSAGIVLPDLTSASETAVQGVVSIENVRKVPVHYGGGMGGGGGMFDPFEFFFGPQQQPQPQQRQPQQQPEQQFREQRSGGSGVILAPDGYIVTNNHVIDGADVIKVKTSSGAAYDATLVGTDPGTDIALLKIEATDLPVLAFGSSDSLRLGQWVLAVGNPMGLTSTVTAGIVSATGRSIGAGGAGMLDIESFIQTDAVVNPGNSGGALVTTDGRLVGINTILKSNTGSYIGYSFAVPSSIVQKVVDDLKQYGTVQRAVLGIAYSELSPEWLERFGKELDVTAKEGLYVGEVTDEGAAKEAGVKKGDVITALNGKPISSSASLQESLAMLRPGDKVNISVKRGGDVKQFDITLRNRAGKSELLSRDAVDVVKLLGGKFQDAPASTLKKLGLKHGIQIVEITPGGMLAKSRVRTGFIITEINGVAIRTVGDLRRITDKVEALDGVYPDGKQVMYQVINN